MFTIYGLYDQAYIAILYKASLKAKAERSVFLDHRHNRKSCVSKKHNLVRKFNK